MSKTLQSFNLLKWIDENKELLKPPVNNKVIWQDSEFIAMILGGPNRRRDFHVIPDEFSIKLKVNVMWNVLQKKGSGSRHSKRRGCIYATSYGTAFTTSRC